MILVHEITEARVFTLDDWLNKLETRENCRRSGTMDSNGELSYGALCFQSGTFKEQAKKYTLFPFAEDAEIMNFIGDRDSQFALAKKMLQDNPENWRRWFTSTKKIGLPPV